MSTPTIAQGAALTPETWDDFVSRLHHDCVGEGVRDHCTADAVFLVQKRVKSYCAEGCDGEAFDIYCSGDGETCNADNWYDWLSEVEKRRLDAECAGNFLAASKYDQINALREICPNADVHEFNWSWEFVNQHFTKDAAEAFIRRKKHDYPDGLRVYVDCTYYSWELNTIKAAILSGQIGFIDAPPVAKEG